jgi:hypothetical protein
VKLLSRIQNIKVAWVERYGTLQNNRHLYIFFLGELLVIQAIFPVPRLLTLEFSRPSKSAAFDGRLE